MKVVVDTNIIFSSILNTNSTISQILLQEKSPLVFYTTERLLTEIERHRSKLIKLSSYTDAELSRILLLVISKVLFIDVFLIPKVVYQNVVLLTTDVDLDDTEFVALAEYLKAKLWTGDKALINGLTKKGWNKFISTNELFEFLLAGK